MKYAAAFWRMASSPFASDFLHTDPSAHRLFAVRKKRADFAGLLRQLQRFIQVKPARQRPQCVQPAQGFLRNCGVCRLRGFLRLGCWFFI